MTPAGVAGERAELFAYDPGAALDFRAAAPAHVVSTGARVEDVTFASPCGGRAPAYLVVPPGGGPFAAVLFMHAGQLDRTSSSTRD